MLNETERKSDGHSGGVRPTDGRLYSKLSDVQRLKGQFITDMCLFPSWGHFF